MATTTKEKPTELLSYHSDPRVKAKYLKRVRAHEKADEIMKGKYWQDGKGCAVGCLVHCSESSSVHSIFPTLEGPGWPEWLARLVDTLFEGLPNGHAKSFPAKLTAAIPVGKNLEPVRFKFALVLLSENAERVKNLKIDDAVKKQVLDAIEQVAAVNRDASDTSKLNESAAESAARSARSAESAARSAWSAESAARSAESAESAARSAAWSAESAARSAARSAESAASSAASSAARSAESAARSAWSAESAARSAWSAESAARSAWSAAYIRYADELLKLLKAA